MAKYYVVESRKIPAQNGLSDIGEYDVTIAMKEDCTTSDLPTDVAPGSRAFKIDNGALKLHIFSADKEWKEITT